MRVHWHSHSPACTTGYGTPTALWLPRLARMGHEVTASAFWGQAQEVSLHQGIPVLNADDGKYGATVLPGCAAAADVTVTLMDIWALDPDALAGTGKPAACWFPVDTTPLSALDGAWFRRCPALPVAMSEHGARMLTQAGLDGTAIPYAFDPAVFSTTGDRDAARAQAGLDGLFAVGINAANVERKAWPEQLAAYARLWREHPGQVVLLANTSMNGPVQLAAVTARLGLPPEAVRWGITGLLDDRALASWYRALDVLCACSYAEGFCLPVVEAEACGTPVVVTDAPPVNSEAGLPGRKAACEPMWSAMHQAWWHRPSITAIHEALEDAFAARGKRETESAAAAAHAARYAADAVAPLWESLLEKAAAG